MNIETLVLSAMPIMASAIAYMFKRLERRLIDCEKERLELLKHIVESNTHREFKEKVQERMSGTYKTLK